MTMKERPSRREGQLVKQEGTNGSATLNQYTYRFRLCRLHPSILLLELSYFLPLFLPRFNSISVGSLSRDPQPLSLR